MPKLTGSYDAYLRSPRWRRLRAAVLERDHHRCRLCGSRTHLEVHHLTYENLGREELVELITTCDSCHEGLHRRKFGPRRERRPYTYRSRKGASRSA